MQPDVDQFINIFLKTAFLKGKTPIWGWAEPKMPHADTLLSFRI